jgi:dTDP-4-dehydrorhamnose reductase
VKVLVTGSNGQVGRALRESAPPGISVSALSHADLDIADAGAVAAVFAREAPQLVINAAAYTAVDKAESDRDAAHAGNAAGPRLLAQAASRLADCRLIHISTDFVFDGTASQPYATDARPNPLGEYGRSKLLGDQAVHAELGMRAIVVRTAWVYDASGRNFLSTMLRLMGEKRKVAVVCDQVGTPTSARPLAAALWRMAAAPGLHGTFHWTDAGVASWYDFAVAIAEEGAAVGLLPDDVEVSPIATYQYPTPAKRPAYSVLDKSEAIRALGFAPAHWRKELRRVMAERKNG